MRQALYRNYETSTLPIQVIRTGRFRSLEAFVECRSVFRRHKLGGVRPPLVGVPDVAFMILVFWQTKNLQNTRLHYGICNLKGEHLLYILTKVITL